MGATVAVAEMNAVFARETKSVMPSFVPEALVDFGLHVFVFLGRVNSSAITVSTWLVSGNISNVSIERGA